MNGKLEIKRLTPPPEEIDMSGIDNALMFSYMIGGLAVIWFLLYLLSLYRLNQSLQNDGDETWQNAGKPTLFKTNLTFYKFVFGKAIADCSVAVKRWGRAFRLLSFSGVFVFAASIYAYFQLMSAI